MMWPRSAGSWPGYIFTNPPLSLPAGHFGLGHGSGAHAPNEYYVIESSNPKVCWHRRCICFVRRVLVCSRVREGTGILISRAESIRALKNRKAADCSAAFV